MSRTGFLNARVVGRVALAVLLLSSALPPPASAQEIKWIRQFDGGGGDTAQAVAANATGVYAAGYIPLGLLVQGAAVIKYDTDGNLQWLKRIESTSDYSIANGVSVDTSGVYVAGYTLGTLPGQTSSGGLDAFVRKYDAEGNELWTRQFSTSGRECAVWGVSSDVSGVYLVGQAVGALPGQTSTGWVDAFVRKYDADGNELWTRQFGTVDYDSAYAVWAGSSGVYLAGVTFGALPGQTSAGLSDAFVRKYDADGNELWTRQFGSSDWEYAFGISADPSGVYVGGQTNGILPGQVSAGSPDSFVRKYDANGNELWTRQFGSAGYDWTNSVSADDSGVYAAGGVEGALPGQASAGGEDGYVRKYDANGDELWTVQFGTAGFLDAALGVSTFARSIYVAGIAAGVFPGQMEGGLLPDVFVAKLQGASPTPAEMLQQLVAQVVALNLKQGISNSLDGKLDAALQAVDDMNENNNVAAVNALQAFINSVEAQRGIHISEADADAFIASAQQIISVLTGP